MSTMDAQITPANAKPHFRSYLPLTFLIGFGFFTVGLMDPLYDSYVQIFLAKYIPYKWVIGLLMSLDNLFALFLIPVVSVWSDHTESPIGRRMPWIVTLLPLSAIAFALVPYAAEYSLLALVALLLVLNLFKQSARGPVVALMPDIVPGEFRSQANGVINTMGKHRCHRRDGVSRAAHGRRRCAALSRLDEKPSRVSSRFRSRSPRSRRACASCTRKARSSVRGRGS